MPPAAPLRELAALFLRLGITAFGGPAAHIAMMRAEVVERLKWLSDREFLDLLAATNLIPGPNSTEMAIHLGYRRAGLPGLLVAGSCFILPAALIVGGIAWGYARYGETPAVGWLMYGIGPVVIAIVLQALVKLGQAALDRWAHGLIAGVALAAALGGVNELLLLAAGAGAGLLLTLGPGQGGAAGVWLALPTLLSRALSGTTALAAAALAAAETAPFTLTRLGLFFLKAGSILFGSGYVLLAFLRADLVERWSWLTDQQLIDAITVGQMTPGPVFTTATFIGYLPGRLGRRRAGHGRHLRARLRPRRRHATADPPDAGLTAARRLPRRGGRRLARPDGVGNLAARACGAGRSRDRDHRRGGGGRPAGLAPQRHLADPGRRGCRVASERRRVVPAGQRAADAQRESGLSQNVLTASMSFSIAVLIIRSTNGTVSFACQR